MPSDAGHVLAGACINAYRIGFVVAHGDFQGVTRFESGGGGWWGGGERGGGGGAEWAGG